MPAKGGGGGPLEIVMTTLELTRVFSRVKNSAAPLVDMKFGKHLFA